MTEPTDAELDTVLCNQWPAFSMQATLVRVWVRAAMRDALAKWGTPQPVACEPLIRQMRDALSLPCDRWNATQSRIVREAIDAADAWLEGKK